MNLVQKDMKAAAKENILSVDAELSPSITRGQHQMTEEPRLHPFIQFFFCIFLDMRVLCSPWRLSTLHTHGPSAVTSGMWIDGQRQRWHRWMMRALLQWRLRGWIYSNSTIHSTLSAMAVGETNLLSQLSALPHPPPFFSPCIFSPVQTTLNLKKPL